MKNKKPKNKEELSPQSGKKRINSRDKGNRYEQWVARMFREQFNYRFAKTTRNSSKMLDDSGIDVSGIPYCVQAKSGYWDRRPKADNLFKSMDDHLSRNFAPEERIHQYPKFLFHRLDGHHPYHHLVTMPFDDWTKIMKVYEKHKNDENEENQL